MTPNPDQLSLGINVKTPNLVLGQTDKPDDTGIYAEVLLDLETAVLAGRTFHYMVPPDLLDDVQPGVLVTVPFGRIPQRTGYVLSLTTQGPQAARPLTSLISPYPILDPARLDWLRWMADYTGTPLATVVSTAIPPALFKTKKLNQQLQLRRVQTVRALQATASSASTLRQQQILDWLLQQPSQPVPLSLLKQHHTVAESTLHRMSALGLLSWQTIEAPQDTTRPVSGEQRDQSAIILSDSQQAAVDSFLKTAGHFQYLYGVTGSGKTQVYLEITQQLLEQGHSVLILVPEIALTSQIAQAFIRRFGRTQLALWHSQLSATERVDTWWQVSRGDIRIVIGPRSALFLPLQNLGAILMDEAHDGSFKQDTPAPRYDAREASVALASRLGARVIFGSATPDVARFDMARRERQILTLPARFGNRAMAQVELVDMREERKLGSLPVISQKLADSLAETLRLGQQAIVLVNRRGFYTQIQCQACDYTLTCPHCTVALTMHQPTRTVRCHYCGWESDLPTFCPKCASFELRQAGVGTQRVAHTLGELLPEVRILRLDSDVLARKNAHHQVFAQFANHQADILVGTQMVAKGLDIANVTLVGVIGGDSGLNLPDYLSSERTFQLLTQVAGRAGRGSLAGRVLVQTRLPHHPVMLLASQQDYDGFFAYEREFREREAFPPFSQLIRLLVSSEDEAEAETIVSWVAVQVRDCVEALKVGEQVQILGPAPCVISKIQDRYRFHLLIKNQAGAMVHQALTQWSLQYRPPKGVHCIIDVDTQTLL